LWTLLITAVKTEPSLIPPSRERRLTPEGDHIRSPEIIPEAVPFAFDEWVGIVVLVFHRIEELGRLQNFAASTAASVVDT
jgi:hypothetical protein